MATQLADLPQDALLSLLTHVAAAANTGQLLKLALVSRQHLELIAHADWFWQQQSEALRWIRCGGGRATRTGWLPNVTAAELPCICRPGIRHPPRAERPNPAHQQHALVHGSSCCALRAGSKQQLSGAAEAEAGRHTSNGRRASRLWFEYYCLRMNCRWRLRLVDTQQALGTIHVLLFLLNPSRFCVCSRNHRCVVLCCAGSTCRMLVCKYLPFLNIQSRLAMQAGASLLLLQRRRARALAWCQV